MTIREYYLQVLDLDASANDAEVKRKYRKLAFKYHPDHSKTPEDYEKFIAATEAYEFLVEGKISKRVQRLASNFYNQAATHDSEKEESKDSNDPRYRKSMKYRDPEQFERMRTEQREFNERTNQNVENIFRNSWLSFFAASISIVCFVLGTAISIDYFLPVKQRAAMVTGKGFDMTGEKHYVQVCNLYYHVDHRSFSQLSIGSEVVVYYTPVLKELMSIGVHEENGTYLYRQKNSVFLAFPILTLLLIIPFVNWLFPDNTIRYYVLYFYTVFVCPMILFIVLSEAERVSRILVGLTC